MAYDPTNPYLTYPYTGSQPTGMGASIPSPTGPVPTAPTGPNGQPLQPGQGYGFLSVNGGTPQVHYADNSPGGVAASQAALTAQVAAGAAPTTTAYSDAAFQAILRKYPSTAAGVQQAIAEANRTFGTSIVSFGSKGDKVTLPDGRQVDVLIGAGSGSPQYGWQIIDPNAPAGGTGPVDLSKIAIDPSFLAPFTGAAPIRPDTPFVAPPDFVAPTAQSVLSDPSYQFRVDQGRGAIENSAAAKGVLNSGGTLNDILNFGQQAGSQEFDNIFNRDFGLWNANWNNALTAFRANKDVNDSNYQQLFNAYTQAKDTFYQNQNSPFSKLIQVAQLGANAAGA